MTSRSSAAALALALSLPAAAAAPSGESMPWQKVVLEKGISLEAPPAWKVAKRWDRKDPEAVLSAYSQSIRVRLYGGKGSSYATIEEFLD
ncbi:MAG: hypothetical protein AAB578_09315, partial [Elusimicrobiota bacterium]